MNFFNRKSKTKTKDAQDLQFNQIVVDIRVFATDRHPIVLQMKTEVEPDKFEYDTYRFNRTVAEDLLERFKYLLSGIQDIEGIDFD